PRPPPPPEDGPAGRGEHPREQLEQRRLYRAVGADDAQRLSRADLEGDLRERRAASVRRRRLARQDRRLQRPVRTPRVAAEDLGDAPDRDRRLARAHASSARESRRRSNTAPPTASDNTAQPAIQAQSAAGTGRKKKRVSCRPEKNGAQGFTRRTPRQRSGTASTGYRTGVRKKDRVRRLPTTSRTSAKCTARAEQRKVTPRTVTTNSARPRGNSRKAVPGWIRPLAAATAIAAARTGSASSR